MSYKVIVMVSDLDDPKHGDLNVLEGQHNAARVVETLLEAGFAEERIRIFNGEEMGMQVAHRPVVALLSGEAPSNSSASVVEEARTKNTSADAMRMVTQVSSQPRTGMQQDLAEMPFVRNGVRFSTQFRPA